MSQLLFQFRAALSFIRYNSQAQKTFLFRAISGIVIIKLCTKTFGEIIRIPQATSFTIINENIVSEGDWDIVGLNVSATIYHELLHKISF